MLPIRQHMPTDENNHPVAVQACLDSLTVIELGAAIKEATVRVRRAEAIPLPDAIIAGTAAALDALVTNDSRLQNLETVRVTGLPMLNGHARPR